MCKCHRVHVQLTVAHYTPAPNAFLTIFTVIYIGLIAAVRAQDPIQGLVLGVVSVIVISIGQFKTSMRLLWRDVNPGPQRLTD